MRGITESVRRATQDLDLDFIKYSLDDDSIRRFIDRLNCIDSVLIEITGSIQELSQQEYRGKRVHVNITDSEGTSITTLMNAESTRAAYEWLAKGIDTFMNVSDLQNRAYDYYMKDYDNNSRENIEFTKELFKAADISISDIDYSYRKIDELPPDVPRIMINNEPLLPAIEIRQEVNTEHIVTDEDGNIKKYKLSLQEESLGTTMLFLYGPFLKETLDKGKVLFIDEIDRSMHPFVVSYLIDLFSSNRNNGAQLIATTHDTLQLSLDRFRRDQIYFTEKNPKTGASDLYSLDDFEKPVRKDENIRKKYLQGRCGAIPYVHAEDLL